MSLHPSLYDEITIQSESDPNRKVDLRMGVASINFFENVLCPTMSMQLLLVDSGGSIASEDTGRKTTIYEGLPIRGGEKVYIRIKANSFSNLDLDFTATPFYVRGVKNASLDTKKQVFTLDLVSANGINNEIAFVKKVFPVRKVTDIAQEIVRDNLQYSPSKIKVDQTSNSIGYSGNLQKPFSALLKLASRGIYAGNTKVGGTAGYFVYETRRGMNFRSIDSLIGKRSMATYVYTEVNINEVDFKPTPDLPSLDRKIIKYTILKNQDMIANLKTGLYSTERRIFNPIDYTIIPPDQGGFKISDFDNQIPTLGLDPVGRKSVATNQFINNNIDPFQLPSRILSSTGSYGTYTKDVTQDIDFNEFDYSSQSLSRYNSLFSQVISLLVPLNTQLHAGDIITIKVPETNTAEIGDMDRKNVSGKYMIKEICHSYSADASYSSMKIVRDTFGYKA